MMTQDKRFLCAFLFPVRVSSKLRTLNAFYIRKREAQRGTKTEISLVLLVGNENYRREKNYMKRKYSKN